MISEAYLGPYQTSTMELFAEIIKGWSLFSEKAPQLMFQRILKHLWM